MAPGHNEQINLHRRALQSKTFDFRVKYRQEEERVWSFYSPQSTAEWLIVTVDNTPTTICAIYRGVSFIKGSMRDNFQASVFDKDEEVEGAAECDFDALLDVTAFAEVAES